MIKFENVSFTYRGKGPFGKSGRQVLQGVDFALGKGEIICILGPSGCGKTTMVNLIMGNLVPSEGRVTVMGEVAPYKNVRSEIGFMPQDNALYEDITARENLCFFGTVNGMKRSEMKARQPEIFDAVKLEGEENTLVSKYSGGMKRRLSLAIAMFHDPELLILDEPTVGLDPDHRLRIWNNFEAMAEEGKTILITTHVMDEAERCNRIAMVYDGRIIASGSPRSIIDDMEVDKLEDAFIKLENSVKDKEASND